MFQFDFKKISFARQGPRKRAKRFPFFDATRFTERAPVKRPLYLNFFRFFSKNRAYVIIPLSERIEYAESEPADGDTHARRPAVRR